MAQAGLGINVLVATQIQIVEIKQNSWIAMLIHSYEISYGKVEKIQKTPRNFLFFHKSK
jgi:hypothetical protein